MYHGGLTVSRMYMVYIYMEYNSVYEPTLYNLDNI